MPPSLTPPIAGPLPATTQLQLLIDAARAAAEDQEHPDAIELEIFADTLAEQAELVFPRGADDRPFVVLGGDGKPLLHWAQTAVEAALADLRGLVEDWDVEFEGLEMQERADQRRRDMEDLFRSGAWISWTVRVYDVLAADLSRRCVPLYGEAFTGSRLPLVETFTAYSYSGDEVGPWEWAREYPRGVGDPRP